MKNRIYQLLSNKSILIAVYTLLAFIATFQALNPTHKWVDPKDKVLHCQYNNYIIFKNSFHHLKEGKDLYITHPDEQFDLYKYTPTFAAFFGFFATLPDAIGLTAWNLLNALLLLAGVYALPKLSKMEKGAILVIVVVELVTSLQNEQSNGLMVGLILMMFSLLEKQKYGWATFLIVFSIYIKLFSIVSLVLFLFYPKKLKLAAYSLLWAVLLFLVPFLFINVDQYSFLAHSYLDMLSHDHSTSLGYSVMGILNSWFGLNPSKLGLVSLGGILLLIPFLKIKAYRDQKFRLLALAFLLIWIVIFNHKAESPTFIISMVGIALWFMLSKKDAFSIGVLIFAIVFTSLSSTDLFPPSVRENFIKPYAIKAVGSVLVWSLIFIELIRFKPLPKNVEHISENPA